MNVKVPTVTVKGDKGPVTINQADYDEKVHELVTEKPVKKETAAEKKARLKAEKEATAEKKAAEATAEKKATDAGQTPEVDFATLGVLEENGKHFVVDGEANKIELAGIEIAGYDDVSSAWVAIAELKK